MVGRRAEVKNTSGNTYKYVEIGKVMAILLQFSCGGVWLFINTQLWLLYIAGIVVKIFDPHITFFVCTSVRDHSWKNSIVHSQRSSNFLWQNPDAPHLRPWLYIYYWLHIFRPVTRRCADNARTKRRCIQLSAETFSALSIYNPLHTWFIKSRETTEINYTFVWVLKRNLFSVRLIFKIAKTNLVLYLQFCQ